MRGVILDPVTGKPASDRIERALTRDHPGLALLERSRADSRFARVMDNLRLAAAIEGGPMMADGVNYRDTRAFSIADATQVAGTSETILWTQAQAQTALAATYWSPPNLPLAGKIVCLTVAGKITSASSSQGNITLTLRAGTTTSGTSVAASAATALAASKTNISWCFQGWIICTAIGTSGKLRAWGEFTYDGAGALFTTTAQNPLLLPATSAAADTTFDTTAGSGVILTSTLGSASDTQTATFVQLEAAN